jgi:hypothetical protein
MGLQHCGLEPPRLLGMFGEALCGCVAYGAKVLPPTMS